MAIDWALRNLFRAMHASISRRLSRNLGGETSHEVVFNSVLYLRDCLITKAGIKLYIITHSLHVSIVWQLIKYGGYHLTRQNFQDVLTINEMEYGDKMLCLVTSRS